MSTRPHPEPAPNLSAAPAGWTVLRELARGPQGIVSLVERGTERGVLRMIEGGGSGPDRTAELAVLARVQHPGLARLLAHGRLPGRDGLPREFTIRSWIEGVDLATYARAAPDSTGGSGPERGRRLGELVARLCPALEHLHRSGFLHADLKPTNIIVDARSEPVLTDFGLARSFRGPRAPTEIAGTLFAIAPEVLLGQRADARADLFALGVLLHELLLGRRTSARQFYARFPEQDFFAATETRAADLPEWARDVVARLVDRDPARRPASAMEVARTLAARLSIAIAEDLPLRVEWGVERGREPFFAGWIESLRADYRSAADDPGSRRALSPRWVRVPEGDETRDVLSALRLDLALEGSPVVEVDLRQAARDLDDGAALDRWLESEVVAARGSIVFALLDEHSAWERRLLEGLACAVAQASAPSDSGDPALLVSGGHGAPPETQAPTGASARWIETELPPIELEAVEAALAAEIEDPPERVTELARLVHAASGGGAFRLRHVLARAGDLRWFVSGARGLRLRPGLRLPATWTEATVSDAAVRELGHAARVLLAALRVCGGRAPLGLLRDLSDMEADVFAAAVAELGSAHIGSIRSEPGDLVFEGPLVRASLLGLDRDVVSRLHARRAVSSHARAEGDGTRLIHAWCSDPTDDRTRGLRDAMRDLREDGVPARALELFDRVRAFAEDGGTPLPAPFITEAAHAWIALGRPELALATAEPLTQSTDPASRASAERVLAAVAILRHEWVEARACFTRAEALSSEDSGETWLGRARLCFETRDDAGLDALHARLESRGDVHLAPRVAASIESLYAMSLFRRGEVDAARSALDALLAAAVAARDERRQADALLNLATIARRGGDRKTARDRAKRAAELYASAGHMPGLGQAQALLAGILREAGELRLAEPLFTAAQELRERLGDGAGATAVRGMIGLLAADRGHVRVAQQELDHAARVLRESGRASDARVLEARADETRARFTAPAADAARFREKQESEGARVAEGDPRILVSRARRAWLSGDRAAARDSAERARELSRRLRLPVPEAEARLVLSLLARTGEREIDVAHAVPVEDEPLVAPHVDLDRRLLAGLSGDLRLEDAARGALTWARELAVRGSDDRAARLALAVAARAASSPLAREARALADDTLTRCGAGLGVEELARLRTTLLGVPDPWPSDLDARSTTGNEAEEWDMDVVSLLELNHRLVRQEALEDLLGAIVESALSVTGAERGFLVLEEDGELSFDTALDSRRGDIAVPDVEVSKSIVREALEAGRVLRLSNAVDDPLLGGAPSVNALDLRSILCAPFTVEPGLRGVVYLDHRLQQGAFAEKAEKLLALLADQAALAIRQVRRVAEIKRLNRELNKQMARKESDLRSAQAALRDANLALPASGMIGTSAPMRAVHRLIERAAPSKLAVLVGGASGTGKELVARALHALSDRSRGPFVSENCAAFPASLIESELFGSKKGAFTGADTDRPGMFERAEGGTLFLDEIGELPLDLQAKLLRVLETGEVRRVGDTRVRQVDFRLVAATNRDLEAEVRDSRFRADLFYRLDGLRIALVPLAERLEDVPLLVDHFMRLEEAKTGARKSLAPAVLARLCRREWPGNVRELANEVARLWVLSEGDIVDPELVRVPSSTRPGSASSPLLEGDLPTMEELEKRAILKALELCDGDKRRAADLLGISRAKVYQRLKDWRLDGGSDAGSGRP